MAIWTGGRYRVSRQFDQLLALQPVAGDVGGILAIEIDAAVEVLHQIVGAVFGDRAEQIVIGCLPATEGAGTSFGTAAAQALEGGG